MQHLHELKSSWEGECSCSLKKKDKKKKKLITKHLKTKRKAQSRLEYGVRCVPFSLVKGTLASLPNIFNSSQGRFWLEIVTAKDDQQLLTFI